MRVSYDTDTTEQGISIDAQNITRYMQANLHQPISNGSQRRGGEGRDGERERERESQRERARERQWESARARTSERAIERAKDERERRARERQQTRIPAMTSNGINKDADARVCVWLCVCVGIHVGYQQ